MLLCLEFTKDTTKKYICYLPKYTRLVHKKKNHPEVRRLNELKDTIKVIGEKYGFEFIDAIEVFSKVVSVEHSPLRLNFLSFRENFIFLVVGLTKISCVLLNFDLKKEKMGEWRNW